MSHAAMDTIRLRVLCHKKIDSIKKERLSTEIGDYRSRELIHAEGLLLLAQEGSGDIFVTAQDLSLLKRGAS